MKWSLASIVVGSAIGWIAVLFSDASGFVPERALALSHFVTGETGPTRFNMFLAGGLCGGALIGIPVYLVRAWKFLAPALRQR